MQLLLRRRKTHPAVRMARESGPALLAGAAAGAAIMFLWDAEGRRRRKLAAEKTGRVSRKTARTLGRRARDVRNRAQGLVAQTRSRFASDDHPADDTLVARVRAQLGHHVSRSGAVETTADDGVVTLRGSVVASELGELLATVRSVRGVREVRNELTVFEHAAEMGTR